MKILSCRPPLHPWERGASEMNNKWAYLATVLKKLGIINGKFPCPKNDFQAVKAVEEAEKRWKTKKSVSFGYDDLLAHAGLHEPHGVHDQQQNHGQVSWDDVKLDKKDGAEGPSSHREPIQGVKGI